MKRKFVNTAVMMMLVAAISVGVTLAYFTDETSGVTNTFVVGEIGELTLEETDTGLDKDGEDNTNTYIVVPGVEIEKDPKVTFTYDTNILKEQQRPAYVFIAVGGSGWEYDDSSKTFISKEIKNKEEVIVEEEAMKWDIVSEWKFLKNDNVAGKNVWVFYQLVDPQAQGYQKIENRSIITGNEIVVDETLVTEENIDDLSNAVSTLEFRAYAIQSEAMQNAADAWSKLNPSTP